jgi:hypothetical protein
MDVNPAMDAASRMSSNYPSLDNIMPGTNRVAYNRLTVEKSDSEKTKKRENKMDKNKEHQEMQEQRKTEHSLPPQTGSSSISLDKKILETKEFTAKELNIECIADVFRKDLLELQYLHFSDYMTNIQILETKKEISDRIPQSISNEPNTYRRLILPAYIIKGDLTGSGQFRGLLIPKLVTKLYGDLSTNPVRFIDQSGLDERKVVENTFPDFYFGLVKTVTIKENGYEEQVRLCFKGVGRHKFANGIFCGMTDIRDASRQYDINRIGEEIEKIQNATTALHIFYRK